MTKSDDAFWAVVFASYTCEEQEALRRMADYGALLLKERERLRARREARG